MATNILNSNILKIAVFFLFQNIYFVNTSIAFTFSPSIKNNQFQILIKDLQIPENFERDLKSGLNNKIIFQYTIVGIKSLSFERAFNVTAKYDLWDDVFLLIIWSANKNQIEKHVLKNEAEVISSLKRLRFVLIDANELSNLNIEKQTLVQIEGVALFNPIAAEKLEKINNWVMQNSTTLVSGGESFVDANSRKVGSQRSNTFFNQIYTEYSKGAKSISIFKDSGELKNILWSEVSIEK